MRPAGMPGQLVVFFGRLRQTATKTPAQRGETMPEPIIYPRAQLPPELAWQVISFMRIASPDTFAGFDWLKYWACNNGGNDHPHHILLVKNGILISHTEVVWKYLDHAGVTYKAYGLTGVFTYPGLRRQGHGTRIVKTGTEYIRQTDADIGIFCCDPILQGFYSNCGWIPMEKTTVVIEPEDRPVIVEEMTMMLFLSESGKRGRPAFETEPVHFGYRSW